VSLGYAGGLNLVQNTGALLHVFESGSRKIAFEARVILAYHPDVVYGNLSNV
jgi:hypothetical protein